MIDRISRIACLTICLLLSLTAHARAEDTTYAMDIDGMKRTWIVHTPPSYNENPPVLIALHGGGGSGNQFMEQSGLSEAADPYGMITVYPNGVPSARGRGRFHTWNAGTCCGTAAEQDANDVYFISAVINSVIETYGADPEKIYVTGHSNGAMMAYRLACEIPEKIAGIAPVGGQVYYNDCARGKKVEVMHIHGLSDKCVPVIGGQNCGGCMAAMMEDLGIDAGIDDHWACDSAIDVVGQRAALNGCNHTVPSVKTTRGDVICENWGGCPQGGETVLCTVKGAGHAWPAGNDPKFCQRRPDGELCRSWQGHVGPFASDVDASAMIVEFFMVKKTDPKDANGQ